MTTRPWASVAMTPSPMEFRVTDSFSSLACKAALSCCSCWLDCSCSASECCVSLSSRSRRRDRVSRYTSQAKASTSKNANSPAVAMMPKSKCRFDWNFTSLCASAAASICLNLCISKRIESIRRLPWPARTTSMASAAWCARYSAMVCDKSVRRASSKGATALRWSRASSILVRRRRASSCPAALWRSAI